MAQSLAFQIARMSHLHSIVGKQLREIGLASRTKSVEKMEVSNNKLCRDASPANPFAEIAAVGPLR